MPPSKLELDNTVVAKFYSNHVYRRFLLPFFKSLYNFSTQLAIDKFLGAIEIDVTNCAVDFLFYFCFICHIYPPFTRKRIVSLYFGREVRTRLGVAFFEVSGPPVFHIKAEASR